MDRAGRGTTRPSRPPGPDRASGGVPQYDLLLPACGGLLRGLDTDRLAPPEVDPQAVRDGWRARWPSGPVSGPGAESPQRTDITIDGIRHHLRRDRLGDVTRARVVIDDPRRLLLRRLGTRLHRSPHPPEPCGPEGGLSRGDRDSLALSRSREVDARLRLPLGVFRLRPTPPDLARRYTTGGGVVRRPNGRELEGGGLDPRARTLWPLLLRPHLLEGEEAPHEPRHHLHLDNHNALHRYLLAHHARTLPWGCAPTLARPDLSPRDRGTPPRLWGLEVQG